MNFLKPYSGNVKRPDGFTLIEVIIAMVIFAIVVVSLMSALTSADRIKARGTAVGCVVTLARNESEWIKNSAQLHGELNDTLYDITCNRKEYSVERTIIKPGMESFSNEKHDSGAEEIEITIFEKNKPANVWHFNLLQGCIN